MANNPIDTNSFRHFLLIRGVEYEIIEPENFDQSNFKIVQDDIARDTFYGNEEAQLDFSINFGYPTVPFMDNNGVLISHLPSGAELLIEENKNYGNEANVKYILKKDNVSFTTGNVDFNDNYESDNETYVKCRIIQNNNQFLIKKREDITVDLLSNEDLEGNTITPIPIQRIFLKAKPVYRESEWIRGQSTFVPPPLGQYNISPFQVIKKGEIENTLSFLSPVVPTNTTPVFDAMSLVEAKNQLTEVKIEIDVEFNSIDRPLEKLLVHSGTASGGTSNYFLIDIQNLPGFYSNTFNIVLPNPVLASERIEILFLRVFGGGAVTFTKARVRMSAVETAISSVGNAVRQIDLIKQTYKAIGSLPVNASKYDVGGEFYDNFLFTKNLIRQDLTKPFNTKLEDVKEDLLEQCAYAQVNDNDIYIGQYEDFYQNIDMGGFLEVPTYESSIIKNIKYLVNKFVFGYEKYEQDRGEKNTNDAIHTNTEWFPQAKNSINTKEFKLPFCRDVFLIETTRKQAFSKDNNSTSDDDNIFKMDVTLLPPNSRNKFTRLLNWQTDAGAGTVTILTDGNFSWTQLGFNVGDIIKVEGVNRTVLSMNETVLKVAPNVSIGTGPSFLTIDYPLTNVLYTNRTNEGLIFSDNLRNSDNFGNLRYSIKRNMRHWFAILATYGKFIPTKKIKNTYFKSNGECITQFTGEPFPIKENEDILISDISQHKILNQDIYKTSVSCSFQQAVQLLNDIQNVRGFIRVQNPSGGIIKGYIKEANFMWSLDELDLQLECKNESDFLNVNFSSGILTINEVGYDSKTADIKLYNIFNDYIQFFDKNNVNLCNRTKFDKVLLNGISYTSVTDLVNAIELL
jgi:hypothetical protein